MKDNLNMILEFGPSIKQDIITIILNNNSIHCKLGKDEKSIHDPETIDKLKNTIIYNLPELSKYDVNKMNRGFRRVPAKKKLVRNLTISLENEMITINGALRNENLEELWLKIVRQIRDIVKF